MRTNIKCFRSDQCSVWTEKQPRMGNHLPHVLKISTKKHLKRHTTWTIGEFSKAYFAARNQKGVEATNGMMSLLSLGNLSFQIWSKQLVVINHWLRRQIDKKCPLIFSHESSWCLFHQSVSQSWQINFRKRVVLRKKGGSTQATLSFQFRLVNVSTEIGRAHVWTPVTS